MYHRHHRPQTQILLFPPTQLLPNLLIVLYSLSKFKIQLQQWRPTEIFPINNTGAALDVLPFSLAVNSTTSSRLFTTRLGPRHHSSKFGYPASFSFVSLHRHNYSYSFQTSFCAHLFLFFFCHHFAFAFVHTGFGAGFLLPSLARFCVCITLRL
jgi:hypothetical protein